MSGSRIERGVRSPATTLLVPELSAQSVEAVDPIPISKLAERCFVGELPEFGVVILQALDLGVPALPFDSPIFVPVATIKPRHVQPPDPRRPYDAKLMFD